MKSKAETLRRWDARTEMVEQLHAFQRDEVAWLDNLYALPDKRKETMSAAWGK